MVGNANRGGEAGDHMHTPSSPLSLSLSSHLDKKELYKKSHVDCGIFVPRIFDGGFLYTSGVGCIIHRYLSEGPKVHEKSKRKGFTSSTK